MSSGTRFVLYYAGALPPAGDQPKIEAVPGLKIVDQTSPKLLLVEAPETPVHRLLEELDGWVLEPERPFRAGSSS